MKMNGTDAFNQLQKLVEKAELENRPIAEYVKKQIQVLQNSHDEFVKMAKAEGYDMDSQRVGDIRVRQYAAMRQLAKKIGLPVDKYDEVIKEIRIKMFGEENYKRFFVDQKLGE